MVRKTVGFGKLWEREDGASPWKSLEVRHKSYGMMREESPGYWRNPFEDYWGSKPKTQERRGDYEENGAEKEQWKVKKKDLAGSWFFLQRSLNLWQLKTVLAGRKKFMKEWRKTMSAASHGFAREQKASFFRTAQFYQYIIIYWCLLAY